MNGDITTTTGNPIDKQIELDLWRRYKRGDVMAARELYERMRPLISSYTNRFRNSGVPVMAIESEARKWFQAALDEYDPSRGAALATYVINRLKRVPRFVERYQNPARIPENRARQIKVFQDAKAHLEVVLGREPSMAELAEDLKWDIRDVQNMEVSLRKALSDFQLQQTAGDQAVQYDRRTQDTLWFLYHQLSNDEKGVMEYLMGWGGKPRLERASDIANALGFSQAKVSRIRAKLEREFEKYH